MSLRKLLVFLHFNRFPSENVWIYFRILWQLSTWIFERFKQKSWNKLLGIMVGIRNQPPEMWIRCKKSACETWIYTQFMFQIAIFCFWLTFRAADFNAYHYSQQLKYRLKNVSKENRRLTFHETKITTALKEQNNGLTKKYLWHLYNWSTVSEKISLHGTAGWRVWSLFGHQFIFYWWLLSQYKWFVFGMCWLSVFVWVSVWVVFLCLCSCFLCVCVFFF